QAVADGLERSGRLITGAAAIMVAVFLAFGLADVVLIKSIGLGLAIAVALDATLVRALIVPAVMRLLGRANWWAPRRLARLHRRISMDEPLAAYRPRCLNPSRLRRRTPDGSSNAARYIRVRPARVPRPRPTPIGGHRPETRVRIDRGGWLLFFAHGLSGLGAGPFVAFGAIYQHDLGASAFEIGLVAAVGMLVATLVIF